MIEKENPSLLIRAWTFGEFCIERREESGLWKIVQQHEWGGNTNSRRLLKYLLFHGRSAGRGLLMNELWPGNDSTYLEEYLNKAASSLRKVFRAEQLLLTKNDRTVYALAGQSLVWSDMDACKAALQKAEYIGHTSTEGCELLESALAYFTRGRLLEGEDGLWCHVKRDMLETAHYRCILWLAEAYAAQGKIRQAEAHIEMLLQKNPFDETALSRLLVLLQQQGLTSQALQRYKNARSLLERQGRHFSSSLESIAQHLENEARPLLLDLTPVDTIRAAVTQGIMAEAHSSGGQDMDQLRREILRQTVSLAGISIVLSSNIVPNSDEIDRLSKMLNRPSQTDETFLKDLDQRTMSYWQSRSESTSTAQDLLTHVTGHLRSITTILEGSLLPSIRTHLCSIAARTALLYGVLFYDLGNYEQARWAQTMAIRASSEAGDAALQAICGGWKSFTWTYSKNYTQALQCVQEAISLAQPTSDLRAQAWLSAVEAEIQAHLQNLDACLTDLQKAENPLDMPASQETYYLFGLDLAQLQGYQGVCLQQFYQKQNPATHSLLATSEDALKQALASNAPNRRKLIYGSDLAVLYARQGEVEIACKYATESAILLQQIEFNVARERLLQIHDLLEPYQDTAPVQALNEQMLPLLSRESPISV